LNSAEHLQSGMPRSKTGFFSEKYTEKTLFPLAAKGVFSYNKAYTISPGGSMNVFRPPKVLQGGILL